jgi:hypothetical protein
VAAARISLLQSLLDSGSLSGAGFAARTVATAVRPAGAFYPAEEAHQRYLERNPGGYCNHMKARGAAAPRSCVEREHVTAKPTYGYACSAPNNGASCVASCVLMCAR